MRILIVLGFVLLPTVVFAQQYTVEDLQAALTEANSQIAGLSQRSEQLAVQVARQNKELADLKAAAEKAKVDAPKEAPKP